jgi:hypothetical protein
MSRRTRVSFPRLAAGLLAFAAAALLSLPAVAQMNPVKSDEGQLWLFGYELAQDAQWLVDARYLELDVEMQRLNAAHERVFNAGRTRLHRTPGETSTAGSINCRTRRRRSGPASLVLRSRKPCKCPPRTSTAWCRFSRADRTSDSASAAGDSASAAAPTTADAEVAPLFRRGHGSMKFPSPFEGDGGVGVSARRFRTRTLLGCAWLATARPLLPPPGNASRCRPPPHTISHSAISRLERR